MAFSTGNRETFGVIEPFDVARPPEASRFSVRPLDNNAYVVEHAFHGPSIIGDGSSISDKHIDTAAAILLDHLSYLADSRKLNRIARFATRPYAGEFSQLSHCFSLGRMGVEFAGGPLNVFDGFYNDSTHVYNGHQGDDNYQGHGKEDLHDYERHDFFTRSGLVSRFVEEGVLRPNGHGFHFANTRLYLASLLDEDEATVRRTFMSNKHKARRMDNDRFQYNQEERYLVELFRHRNNKDPLRVPNALANLSLESIQRMVILEDNEGDQLIYNDDQPAALDTLAYGEHNALHWCEPVQDLDNDLLNLAERYFFVCDDDLARDFQYFYPRDYLHTSATYMFEQFDAVAKRDPFMAWILHTAEDIAADQQTKMADIIDEKAEYSGPNPPAYVKMQRLEQEHVDSAFVMLPFPSKAVRVTLPRGKMRTVDPRVSTGKHDTAPLSILRPDVKAHVEHLHSWIGNYQATIHLDDADINAIRQGLNAVATGWPQAIRRPPMPSSEFRATIKSANDYVRGKCR